MNARVLVVDDDPTVAEVVGDYLRNAGMESRHAADGHTALRLAGPWGPGLVVLDVMMPGIDGLEVCRRLRDVRGEQALLPVIMLTALGEESDRILGLETGADDYITKPFSPRELVARVKAVLRRFETPLRPAIIRIGDLQIDSGAMELKVAGQIVPATATEFRLLEYLARHAGRVFTRDQLLDAVWRDTQYVTPRSVDVYVRRIREKIEPDAENPQLLKTVRGAGYRFEAPK